MSSPSTSSSGSHGESLKAYASKEYSCHDPIAAPCLTVDTSLDSRNPCFHLFYVNSFDVSPKMHSLFLTPLNHLSGSSKMSCVSGYPLKNLGSRSRCGKTSMLRRGLVRKRTGGKVLICLFDSRFSTPNESMIGLIDMNNNIGITYIVLDITMTVEDFEKHVKVLIQSNGYENFQGNNICLDIVVLGKTMRLEWNISPLREENSTIIPTEYSTFLNEDKSLSIRFRNYKTSNQDDVEESDLDLMMINDNEDDLDLMIIDDEDERRTHSLLESRIRVVENRVADLEVKMESLVISPPATDRKGKGIVISDDITMVDYQILSYYKDPFLANYEPGIEQIHIICNPEDVTKIQILAKLNIRGLEITLPAFIDTGATSNTIDAALIPIEFVLTSPTPKYSAQFDDSRLEMTKYIQNVHLKFQTHCQEWSKAYHVSKFWVRPLNYFHIKMILGLDFLLKSNGGMFLTNDFITIFRNSSVSPIISEWAEERGGHLLVPKILSPLPIPPKPPDQLPVSNSEPHEPSTQIPKSTDNNPRHILNTN
ncbi:hypothetical protein M5K25_028172 [Dendrobium thyrsiflorum]|uniref:Peptidase A3B domain-containing protein n=1 Tax=Dendrobium thyrsiflorum TaxID=117978 RepID=A0ABD0TVS1_DENTH